MSEQDSQLVERAKWAAKLAASKAMAPLEGVLLPYSVAKVMGDAAVASRIEPVIFDALIVVCAQRNALASAAAAVIADADQAANPYSRLTRSLYEPLAAAIAAANMKPSE